MTFKEAYKYYEETGWNIDDTRKWLRDQPSNGCEQSYDGSLSVFYFPTCIIMAGPSGLSEFRRA